jgi:hypothetical protein
MKKPTDEEMQHAHDTLHFVLERADEFGLSDTVDATMVGAVAALGWMLQHECGKGMVKLLESVQEALLKAGYVPKKIEVTDEELDIDDPIDVWN